jgi:hypothetical protein
VKHAPETGFHHRDTESEVQEFRSSGVQKFRRPVNGERIEDKDEHDCVPKIRQNFPIWDRSSIVGRASPARPFAVVGLNLLEVRDWAQPKATGGTPVFHLIVGATVNALPNPKPRTPNPEHHRTMNGEPRTQTPNPNSIRTNCFWYALQNQLR